jgi:hypothetical protein
MDHLAPKKGCRNKGENPLSNGRRQGKSNKVEIELRELRIL